jgi:hypothetical protein
LATRGTSCASLVFGVSAATGRVDAPLERPCLECDLGHRGFNGISGWGWLSYVADDGTVLPHVYAADWLFTAELIPAPGAIALMGMGGLLAARRRR